MLDVSVAFSVSIDSTYFTIHTVAFSLSCQLWCMVSWPQCDRHQHIHCQSSSSLCDALLCKQLLHCNWRVCCFLSSSMTLHIAQAPSAAHLRCRCSGCSSSGPATCTSGFCCVPVHACLRTSRNSKPVCACCSKHGIASGGERKSHYVPGRAYPLFQSASYTFARKEYKVDLNSTDQCFILRTKRS